MKKINRLSRKRCIELKDRSIFCISKRFRYLYIDSVFKKQIKLRSLISIQDRVEANIIRGLKYLQVKWNSLDNHSQVLDTLAKRSKWSRENKHKGINSRYLLYTKGLNSLYLFYGNNKQRKIFRRHKKNLVNDQRVK